MAQYAADLSLRHAVAMQSRGLSAWVSVGECGVWARACLKERIQGRIPLAYLRVT